MLIVVTLGIGFAPVAQADWSEDYGFWAAEMLGKHNSEQRYYAERAIEQRQYRRERERAREELAPSVVLPGRSGCIRAYTYYIGNVAYTQCY